MTIDDPNSEQAAEDLGTPAATRPIMSFSRVEEQATTNVDLEKYRKP